MAGSTWATSNELYVGEAGNGTLNITNGGTVLVTQTTWGGVFQRRHGNGDGVRPRLDAQQRQSAPYRSGGCRHTEYH